MDDLELAAGGEASQLPWPCWIEVDLDAIRHNVGAIRELLDPACRVMAVVKAQAYGHGAVPVARAALEAGAAWLAVARAREGMQLREAGLDAPILLLGPFSAAEAPLVVAAGLRPTVANLGQARALSAAAVATGLEVPVHVKMDTGLNRYGLSPAELLELLPRVASLPGLRLEGLYSHLATADDPGDGFAASQLQAFQRIRALLEADGFRFPVVHMANSGGTLGVAGSHLDLVRPGLALYGLYPSPQLAARACLRPALSFHARVARVLRLEPGDTVGYGRTFEATEPVTAALVPVGYADGLPRGHSNRGCLLVNGQRAPLIGRVSMDQCVVDVRRCGPVREGDPVVVIGSQGDETITCEEFAERSGTISYEVVTSLGCRVPRLYRGQGAPVGVAYLDEGRVEGWPG